MNPETGGLDKGSGRPKPDCVVRGKVGPGLWECESDLDSGRVGPSVDDAAFLTIYFRYFPYKADMPFRCLVMQPILSSTSAVSSIRVRTLGARFELPASWLLRRRAKQAANEIIIAVLLGMLESCPSPCIAARMTFRDDESPAAWKKCRTSVGAVGWLMTLL